MNMINERLRFIALIRALLFGTDLQSVSGTILSSEEILLKLPAHSLIMLEIQ